MKSLFYYPDFEIKNEDWLKFALLYVDKLRPIVPASGEKYFSRSTKYLLDQTDLLDFYRPTFDEGYKASLEALDIVEKLLKRPTMYYRTFYRSNILDKFRDYHNHNAILFRDKYTYDFGQFCLSEGLASPHDEGIAMSEELVNIYMTILINIIGEKNGQACITDNDEMDKYNIFLRYHQISGMQQRQMINIAKSTIQLYLPVNLNQIPIDKIIALRNSDNYKELLLAFHKELDAYIKMLENNQYSESFVDYLSRSLFDLKTEILQLGPDLFSFGLGFWYLFSGNVEIKEIVGNIMIGGAVAASVAKVKKCWNNSRDLRFSRKYLTTLRKLPI